MKNKYRVMGKLFLLMIVLLVGVSCTNESNNNNEDLTDKEEINIYFVSQLDGKLSGEKIFLNKEDSNTDEKKVQKAIEAIQEGPKNANLLPVISSDVVIQHAEIRESGVMICLSEEYNDLSVQKQMLMRASFVKTLTSFPFINSVEFSVDAEPLLSIEGEEIGPIFKEDIVLEQPDPKPTTNVQNITLYFGDPEGTGLISENRKIQVSENVPLERYIIEELIKGPLNENHTRTIPEETKLNDIKTKDGVCQIDLSVEFKTKHEGGSAGELYTVYSIVNSLTESSPKVKKVAFLIDGKKQTEFKGHLDLSILFERDESLIAEDKK